MWILQTQIKKGTFSLYTLKHPEMKITIFNQIITYLLIRAHLFFCVLYILFMYYHDITSGSDIAPCDKIYKPLVVYRFCNLHYDIIISLRKR